MCRVPAVIIAAVICGAGVSACGASTSSPSAVASAAAPSGSAGGSPTSALTSTPASSPTPAASPTHVQSAAAKPSVTATPSAAPKSSSHPTSSPTNTSSGGTHNFTVPSIPGDNVVSAYGSYAKIGSARVKVTMCAKQTGTAFSVGAIALVYDASGASKNIGATILTGPGNSSCVSNTFILYTAHLKVHAFIGGSSGTIVKTGPVLTLY
jgi:hypothetical protein